MLNTRWGRRRKGKIKSVKWPTKQNKRIKTSQLHTHGHTWKGTSSMGVKQVLGPNLGKASEMTWLLTRKSEGRPVCNGGKGALLGAATDRHLET